MPPASLRPLRDEEQTARAVTPFRRPEGAGPATPLPAGDAVRKIRVLFLMIQMAMGGTERLVLNLARRLDRRRFEPSVAWLTDGPPLEEFEALEIPLYCLPKSRRFDWGVMRAVGRLVREQDIDVVNAHHFLSFVYAYYGCRIAGRAALVYTEHSEHDVTSAQGKWRTIGGWLARSSSAVVGVSRPVSDTLASHFHVAPRRVHTIENGVDVELFGATGLPRQRARERFGFGPGEVVIGHVANFRHNKNHLFLLRAFRDVLRRRPGVRLVFAGQGFPGDPESSEAEVRAFVRQHGLEERVSLLGYRPDVHDLLRALDVCCLVSYREGLPLSLIEAMATGLAVVGTDVPGIRDVIEPERNGLLVPPDDVAALAGALERLARDEALRDRLGRAGGRTAAERYSLARCVNDTERLFASVQPHAEARLRA